MTQISEVKNRILIAAKELFIKKGYDGTSIRDIATASGTNLAMVNYYFESKYKLFELIFEEFFSSLTERIVPILTSDELPFFELIDAWIDTYFQILLENPHMPIFILREINQNPEQLTQRMLLHHPEETLIKISKRIDEEILLGNITPIPAKNLLLSILSLCIFPFMFGQLATTVSDTTNHYYVELLKEHRNYVNNFVRNALKPN